MFNELAFNAEGQRQDVCIPACVSVKCLLAQFQIFVKILWPFGAPHPSDSSPPLGVSPAGEALPVDIEGNVFRCNIDKCFY